MPHTEGYRRTFTAGGAINKFDRVNLSSGNVVAADADDIGIGNALATVASGEEVAVLLDNAPGTRTCVAASAISVGDMVWQDASGEVSNNASDTFIGIALTAATAQLDEIEVLTGIGGEGGAIKYLEEDFVIGDFTDNGNTTGYVDMAGSIPAGGMVLGWQIVTATGFTGDTTATAQVGDTDVDRFSNVTSGSVLAAGTIGSGMPGGSGNAFCAAATTPRLTVTGSADFTSISAGACTLKVAYLEF